jgi:beta-mannosidase
MPKTSANGTRQALKHWEAVPISALLAQADEARSVRRNWTGVRVPGHWQLQDPFTTYQGIVLYRCRFVRQPAAREEMVSLRFEAVYYSARVWLNGSYLGEHQGYFAAFEFDVTDTLAEDAENELLVEVSSPEELAENDRVGFFYALPIRTPEPKTRAPPRMTWKALIQKLIAKYL